MNYLSYQDEKRRIVEEPSQANFATVVGVYEDGLQLQFDGESEATAKRYRYNKSITFKLGDRVKVTRVSGTYVAEYPIGKGKFSVAPDNVSGINATVGETEVSIQWSDPADKTVDGQLVSKWAGTYLVRNEIDFPKNETDGTQVLNSQTRDAYKSTPFIDKGLTSGKTYYYGLFPYSDDGKVNTNRENTFSLMPERRYQYGVKIDLNNADPETSVEYILDAVGKRPARVNLETGEFDYGDWADVGFVKDCKPCMLRYDGTVDYYLNPNDYSKKGDGTPSNISDINYPANAMVEFPRWYVNLENKDNYLYIIITEEPLDSKSLANAFKRADGTIAPKMYLSMFAASLNSNNISASLDVQELTKTSLLNLQSQISQIGNTYFASSWSERDYISSLLILLSKSLNHKECFGYGPVTESAVKDTHSSMFYGRGKETDDSINIFHMKNWWGNPYVICGMAVTPTQYNQSIYMGIKLYPPYDEMEKETSYEDKFLVSTTSPINAYVGMLLLKDSKIPKTKNGASETTYYCSKIDLEYQSDLYDIVKAILVGDRNMNSFGIKSIQNYDKRFYRFSSHP